MPRDELAAVESRIRRPLRRRRVVGGRDALHPHRRAAETLSLGKDRLGDVGPDRFARGAHVEDAAQRHVLWLRDEVARHSENRVGDVERAGGASPLIRDDTDLVARLRETQHGLDEVLAEGTVDPGRAQDRVVRCCCGDGPLAGQFARAIG